jgi:hypothetical protein
MEQRMTKQQELAQFLDQRIVWPRVPMAHAWGNPAWLRHHYPYQQPRPTREQLAQELLAIPEYRALQLGTWLGTTNGEIITEAVETVTPPFYREDVELLVEALKLAAQLQAQEGQGRAGKIALGAIGAAALFAIGMSGAGSQAA